MKYKQTYIRWVPYTDRLEVAHFSKFLENYICLTKKEAKASLAGVPGFTTSLINGVCKITIEIDAYEKSQR